MTDFNGNSLSASPIDHQGETTGGGGGGTEINDSIPSLTTTFSSTKINTQLATKAPTVHTHIASQISSGTFNNARIKESSVIQHAGAINHSAINNDQLTLHRQINDTTPSATTIYSGTKINTLLTGYSGTGHLHSASHITSGFFADDRVPKSNVTQHILDTGTGTTDFLSASKIISTYAPKANPTFTGTVNSDVLNCNSLVVSGTTTVQNTETVTISDPLIKLADGNTVADTKNIGTYGEYNSSGVKYAGIIRNKATDDTYIISNSITEPTEIVDLSTLPKGNLVCGNINGINTADLTSHITDAEIHLSAIPASLSELSNTSIAIGSVVSISSAAAWENYIAFGSYNGEGSNVHIVVYDVSGLTPLLIQTIQISVSPSGQPSCENLIIAGNKLFASVRSYGIYVFDISDVPAGIVAIPSMYIENADVGGNSVQDCAITGRYLYVLTKDAYRLYTFDLLSPTVVQVGCEINVGTRLRMAWNSANSLYLYWSGDGYEVIDISDRESPVVSASEIPVERLTPPLSDAWQVGLRVSGFYFDGIYMYCSSLVDTKLTKINTTFIPNVIEEIVDTGGNQQGIVGVGDYILITMKTGDPLKIYNKIDMSLVSTFTSAQGFRLPIVNGNKLYVAKQSIKDIGEYNAFQNTMTSFSTGNIKADTVNCKTVATNILKAGYASMISFHAADNSLIDGCLLVDDLRTNNQVFAGGEIIASDRVLISTNLDFAHSLGNPVNLINIPDNLAESLAVREKISGTNFITFNTLLTFENVTFHQDLILDSTTPFIANSVTQDLAKDCFGQIGQYHGIVTPLLVSTTSIQSGVVYASSNVTAAVNKFTILNSGIYRMEYNVNFTVDNDSINAEFLLLKDTVLVTGSKTHNLKMKDRHSTTTKNVFVQAVIGEVFEFQIVVPNNIVKVFNWDFSIQRMRENN